MRPHTHAHRERKRERECVCVCVCVNRVFVHLNKGGVYTWQHTAHIYIKTSSSIQDRKVHQTNQDDAHCSNPLNPKEPDIKNPIQPDAANTTRSGTHSVTLVSNRNAKPKHHCKSKRRHSRARQLAGAKQHKLNGCARSSPNAANTTRSGTHSVTLVSNRMTAQQRGF